MATHSNILAWSIPRTEDPGRWQSVGFAQSQTRLKRHSTHARHLLRNKEEDPFSAAARPGEERGNVPGLGGDTVLPSRLRRKGNTAQGLKRLSHRLLGPWEVGSILSHSPRGWVKAKDPWGSHLEGASLDPDRSQNGSASLPLLGAYSRHCQPLTPGEFSSQAQSVFLWGQ